MTALKFFKINILYEIYELHSKKLTANQNWQDTDWSQYEDMIYSLVYKDAQQFAWIEMDQCPGQNCKYALAPQYLGPEDVP